MVQLRRKRKFHLNIQNPFILCTWLNTGTCCATRSWDPHPWRLKNPTGQGTCSSGLCFGERGWLDGLRNWPPTSTIWYHLQYSAYWIISTDSIESSFSLIPLLFAHAQTNTFLGMLISSISWQNPSSQNIFRLFCCATIHLSAHLGQPFEKKTSFNSNTDLISSMFD